MIDKDTRSGNGFRWRFWPRLLLLFIALLGEAAPSRAQDVPTGVGSADRPRPEYDPIGLRSGPIFIYPSLELGVDYTDNVLAGSSGKQGDALFTVRPAVDVKSDWSRHQITASAYSESRFFTSETGENATDYGVDASGRLDLGLSSRLTLAAGYDRLAENRANIDSTSLTVKPIQSDIAHASVNYLARFNQLRLSASGTWSRLNFVDGELPDGRVVDQDFRDRRVVEGQLGVGYEFSPGYQILLRGSVNNRNYSLDTGSPGFDPRIDIDRDSTGYKVEAGVEFELTKLLYGSARIGYLSQNYQNARLPDLRGVSAGADLLWNVTTLTSLRFQLDRRIDDTITDFSAGRRTTAIRLGVDHELLRNLIISIDGDYTRLNFVRQDRLDRESGETLQIKYLLNRHLTATFYFRHDERKSPIDFFNYQRNAVGLTLRGAL